jgi:hypothetical protein
MTRSMKKASRYISSEGRNKLVIKKQEDEQVHIIMMCQILHCVHSWPVGSSSLDVNGDAICIIRFIVALMEAVREA